MALTPQELEELSQLLDARACSQTGKKAEEKLRRIARDPVKRRKQFKIVPGAALSSKAARLAQFYESAYPEQRAAFDTLMSLFSAGVGGVVPKTG